MSGREDWFFAVLGPLRVSHSGRPVEIRSARQRVLLAALLMRAGQAVSTDELVEHLYGSRPSKAARATLQTYVMRLRRTLRDADERRLIRTETSGYAIHLTEEQLDLSRFHRLRAAAETAAENGDVAEQARLLDTAQSLWRGQPLADVPSLYPGHSEADALNELRLGTIERRNDARLRLGEHHGIIDDLRALVTEHPLRERFWAQLMRALHHSGEHAQALDTYRRATGVLATELGIDPNAELRELHLEVLATPATGNRRQHRRPPSTPVPSWLPADVPEFTGRADEVAQLGAGLRDGAGVWTITGPAGVGKTSLAVHVAHLVRDHYPDGQLYLSLRGTEDNPVDAATALDRMLRGLGVPGRAVPTDPAERADLLRDLLADRRVLLVLDNVADEAHVRTLLPNTTATAAIVTSRRILAGLEGARVVPLDVLSSEAAVDLMRDALGGSRIASDPTAAVRIADYCGHLPLALRVAVARLVKRPHWPLARLADRLSDERRRLDELRVGDLDVRANLACGYDGLDDSHRQAFRLLAALPGPDFPAWVAAPLLDLGLEQAEDHVETLVDARLVACVGQDSLGQPRFRLHDLLRTFGRELTGGADLVPPFRRLFELWRGLVERADDRLPHQGLLRTRGGTGDTRWTEELATLLPADPAAWLDAEWLNIRACVEHSAELGLGGLTGELALATAGFCDLQARLEDWDDLNRVALRAVDPDDVGGLLQQRGVLRARQHRFAEAEADFLRASVILERKGDTNGAGYARHGVGWMHEWAGRQPQAREQHRVARRHFAAAANRHGEVEVLCSLGAIERRAGRLPEADGYLSRAYEIAHRLGDEALCTSSALELGRLHQASGQPGLAAEHLTATLASARRMGDLDLVSVVRLFLADVQLVLGDTDSADRHIRDSLIYAEEHNDLMGQAWALRLLSRTSQTPDTGLRLARRAVALAEHVALDPELARAMRQLGLALLSAGRHDEADRTLRQAAELLESSGFHAEAAHARAEAERHRLCG
ncbi:DNA-binding transcriptional activator of the SARP family [Amycolatopsis marina]|uniref:DNA-binding transcriptional activator of the SARP family n=1 Tax=Amycolatopsis marina TaxID=490629 RepID=A0A1I1B2W3_9PSEU|nr:AfsR/SARP family transcriptional regulator [Amycolatopsis marina]SFB44102.1 DNA-binding transcriptional activator of the SARP family [Amycolatopsis marina]